MLIPKKLKEQDKKFLNQEEVDDLIVQCEQCDKLLINIWHNAIYRMFENSGKEELSNLNIKNKNFKEIKEIWKKNREETMLQVPITIKYAELQDETTTNININTLQGYCYFSGSKTLLPLDKEPKDDSMEELFKPFFDTFYMIKSIFEIGARFEGNLPQQFEVIVDMDNALYKPINNFLYSKYGKYFGVYKETDYKGFVAIDLPITLKEFRQIWHKEDENNILFVRDFREKQKQLRQNNGAYNKDILSQEEIEALLDIVDDKEQGETTLEQEMKKLQKSYVKGVIDACEGLTGMTYNIKVLDKVKHRYGVSYNVENQLVLDKHLKEEPIFYTCTFKTQINNTWIYGDIAFTPSLFITFYELMFGGDYIDAKTEIKRAYTNLQSYLACENINQEMLLNFIKNTFYHYTNTIISEPIFDNFSTISSYKFMTKTSQNEMPLLISYESQQQTQFEGMVIVDIKNFEELLTTRNKDFKDVKLQTLKKRYITHHSGEMFKEQNLNDFINKKSQENNNEFKLTNSCVKCGNKEFDIVFKPIGYDKYYFTKSEYVKNNENYIKKEHTHSYAKDCNVLKEHLVCYCKTCGYAEAIDTKDKESI